MGPYCQTKTDFPSKKYTDVRTNNRILLVNSGLVPVIQYVNSKGFKFGLVSCWMMEQ